MLIINQIESGKDILKNFQSFMTEGFVKLETKNAEVNELIKLVVKDNIITEVEKKFLKEKTNELNLPEDLRLKVEEYMFSNNPFFDNILSIIFKDGIVKKDELAFLQEKSSENNFSKSFVNNRFWQYGLTHHFNIFTENNEFKNIIKLWYIAKNIDCDLVLNKDWIIIQLNIFKSKNLNENIDNALNILENKVLSSFQDNKHTLEDIYNNISIEINEGIDENKVVKNKDLNLNQRKHLSRQELKELFKINIKGLFSVENIKHNPIKIKNKSTNKPLWIFLKNISPTYFNDQTRIQVARSNNFLEIKKNKEICMPVGYDSSNECYVVWNPHAFLSRINEKKNISIYSRLDIQEKAKNSDKPIKFKLSNDEIVYCVNKNFIRNFLNDWHLYFHSETTITENNLINNETILNKVTETLGSYNGIKTNDIVRVLDHPKVDKNRVNKILYSYENKLFNKNDKYQWFKITDINYKPKSPETLVKETTKILDLEVISKTLSKDYSTPKIVIDDLIIYLKNNKDLSALTRYIEYKKSNNEKIDLTNANDFLKIIKEKLNS